MERFHFVIVITDLSNLVLESIITSSSAAAGPLPPPPLLLIECKESNGDTSKLFNLLYSTIFYYCSI
jgi:hypothetical protein